MDEKYVPLYVSVYDNGDEYENRLYHWLRLGYWSLQEAAALISDIEPDSIEFTDDRRNFANALTLRGTEAEQEDVDGVEVDEDGQEFLDETNTRRATLKSYYKKVKDAERILGRISPKLETATPDAWIKTALDHGLDVPWLRWAERVSLARRAEGQSRKNDGPVGEKERASMLKIIAALCAMEEFDKNRATKSATVIRNKCTELGFSISENTIVKYLKEAAGLNPDN